eukprot:SAG31_NODE_4171_length_3511_cov_1.851407_4_plen_74_part_00
MKVALEESDYPLAKMMLRTIRESAAVDDAMAQQKKPGQKPKAKAQEADFDANPLRIERGAPEGSNDTERFDET